jgi:N-acetylglutamate synthase-like GNAT family acetyltransferase
MGSGIRRAVEDDQPAITRMVRAARLNPRGLHWSGFVVAEDGGDLVGVAQVRAHSDGSRELASLVVRPGVRGRGIATAMVDALLAGETRPVFTIVDHRYAAHYERWAFHPVAATGLPPSIRSQYRMGRVVTSVAPLVVRRRIRLVPLRRQAPS